MRKLFWVESMRTDAFTHTPREPSDMAIGIDHWVKSRGAATTTVTQPAKSV